MLQPTLLRVAQKSVYINNINLIFQTTLQFCPSDKLSVKKLEKSGFRYIFLLTLNDLFY